MAEENQLNLGHGAPLGLIIHEISNFLCVIEGISKKLLKLSKDGQGNGIEARDLFQRLDSRVAGTSEMIEAFKEVIRKNSTKLETISWNSAFLEASEIVGPTLEKYGVNLVGMKCESDFTVLSCRPLLLCILTNLLKNACMAAKETELRAVEVKIELHESVALISVLDSGFGIPEVLKDNLFKKRFSTTGIHGGLGLGLLIIEKLAFIINARVYLKPDSQKTEFVLEVPLGAG